MQAPDFARAAQAHLAQQQAAATQQLRRFFAAYPAADYFQFEYLLGLDHAILAAAHGADGAQLAESETVFAGFEAYLAELVAYDQQHGTALAGQFRGDAQVGELVDDWFDACWTDAGGPDLPQPSYYGYEGDESRLNLQTQEWE